MLLVAVLACGPTSEGDPADEGDGGCGAARATEGCVPGTRRCDGASALVCNACGEFVVDQVCPAECVAGECVQCACTPGQSACDLDAIVRCADDCQGFVVVEVCEFDCETGSAGSGPSCRVPICNPGEGHCATEGSGRILTCNASGTAVVASDCDVGVACEEVDGPTGTYGVCPTCLCIPGVGRCSDDAQTFVRCADDCMWWESVPCPNGCVVTGGEGDTIAAGCSP